MSNIAIEKARHPRVREFAHFEHAEQTTAAQVLKSMNPSLSPPAPPQNVTDAISRLKQLRPGIAFDREFVAAQIRGHEAVRTTQQDFLKSGHDLAAVNTAKLLLVLINEHLTVLSDLRHDRLAAL